MTDTDIAYMSRALDLAAQSPFDTHPNPMVGAVIVADGRIIGEGAHRRCGQGHAEVNAIASVSAADRPLLSRATMYVTLEPCSHYGKTPPCARLIIDTGIPRVVVGAVDPFEKVAGRGIAMLRDAGVEVEQGVLAERCELLNVRFMTAHRCRRPYVTLKWAQSSDGYMDAKRGEGDAAYRFSNAMTSLLTHRERAMHDGILTTAATVVADNPRLDTRLCDGPSPRRIVVDRHGRLGSGYRVFEGDERPTLLYRNTEATVPGAATVVCQEQMDVAWLLADLYNRGITSVLVEAGPTMLNSFIASGLWDAARVETSAVRLGARGTHPAPRLDLAPIATHTYGANTLALLER